MSARYRLGTLALDAALLGALIALHLGLHALWQSPLGIDNRPAPDAMEHIGVAESLLRHGVPAIEMGDGSLLPSRYELGYPFAVAAWRWLTGGGQTSALSLNLALSVLCIALTYLLGRRLAGPWAGALSGLFTVLCPRLLVTVELAMSEPLAMCLALVGSLLALSQAARRRRGSAAGLGFAMGALAAVRLTHVLLFVHLVFAALGGRRRRRFAMFLWGCLGLLPWVALLAFAHHRLNGGPLVQGYDLWAPYAVEMGTGWHWGYMVLGTPPVDPSMRQWIFAPHLMTYLPMLLGLPAKGVPPLLLYPWPLVVGMFLALTRRRRPLRRWWGWTVVMTAAVMLSVWGCYYFWAPRFFLPVVPPLIALGCSGLVLGIRRGGGVRALCIALLALGTLQQSLAVMWFLDHRQPMASSERLALRALSEELPPDAVIIVDTFLILAREELGGPQRDLLNWAIDGRDILLLESRRHGVPALRPGSGAPTALFHEGTLDQGALQVIRERQRAGRTVWIALERGQVEAGLFTDEIGTLGLTPEPDGPPNPVFLVWQWPPSTERSSAGQTLNLPAESSDP